MFKYFQNKYALSDKGTKHFIKSIYWTIFLDLSFMIPVVFGFKF